MASLRANPSGCSVALRVLWPQHDVLAQAVEASTFAEDKEPLSPCDVRSQVRVLRETGRAQRYLFKHLAPDAAHLVEAVTVLANAVGLETPLALACGLQVDGGGPSADGVLIPWLEDMEAAGDHDFARASPPTLTYVVLSRWFNELVGNQDCWFGQFLRPAGTQRYERLVNIDFDGAFARREAGWYQRELRERCGLERTLADCRDRPFRFAEPLGWKRHQYDCRLRFYGPLFKAYLSGEIELPHARIGAALAHAARRNGGFVARVFEPFLAVSQAQHLGMVALQGARRFVTPAMFRQRLVDRYQRSFAEFAVFLARCRRERDRGQGPMTTFYATSAPAAHALAVAP